MIEKIGRPAKIEHRHEHDDYTIVGLLITHQQS